MKTKIFLLLVLANLPLAQAQTQWRLEAFLEYFGHVKNSRIGSRVKGFVGSYANNPYNVAVASSPYDNHPTGLNFYNISSPQDTTPLWIIPNGADVEYGNFNGDGFTDFAVWQSVNMGSNDTVSVYLGNATGIETVPVLKLPEEKPQTGFGSRICVGDLNNDQIDDIVVTAPSYYVSQGNNGKVYVYFGGSLLSSTPDLTIAGSHDGAGLGSRCAIGDFDDDGLNDLAISGFDQTRIEGSASFGYVNIYFGSASFDTLVDLISPKAYRTSEDLAALDADGDEKIDLLWTFADSVSSMRSVFIHYGGNNFRQLFQAGPDFIIHAPVGSCNFGNEICSAGDMNGDGDEDLLIAANCTAQGNGIVFVFTGGKALDDRFDAARGQALEGAFGSSLSNIGDINHDGYSDIIIGAPNQPWSRYDGYFGIFLGDPRILTSVEDKNQEMQPSNFVLHPSYPNPLNQETVFKFSLSRKAVIEIKIYNILGKEVRDLLYAEHAPNQYQVYWDGRNNIDEPVPNGIYLVRMRAFAADGSQPLFEQVQKFTVVR